MEATLDRALLEAVPAGARDLLHLGCGDGALGAALKRLDPARRVVGVERDPTAAALAAGRLDALHRLDLDHGLPALPSGSVDAILVGGLLGRVQDPAGLLARCRPLLRPGGRLLASVANAQHHAALAALLAADLPPAPPRRSFTYACLFRLLLDAGYLPALAARTAMPAAPGFHAAAAPLLAALGLHAGRVGGYLDTARYLLSGRPRTQDLPAGEAAPVTLVTAANNEAVLAANLLASPDLRDGRHELLVLRGCASAAEAINHALACGRHDLVIWAHQDVYLPRGWIAGFRRRWAEAATRLGPLGLAGVYGVRLEGERVVRAGRVVDRDRLLDEAAPLPAPVDTLDELLLALPGGSPLRADPDLGFHFYGADLALQAGSRGLAVAALDAPCLHHSRGVGLPQDFPLSATAFATKWWTRLPVATSCVLVAPDGALRVS